MIRTRVRLDRLGLLAAVLCGVVMTAGRATDPETVAVSSRRHVVQPGDTLWEIARLEVGSRGDPRPVIERIREVNELRGALLEPGATLTLP